ncbi:MAG: helix-turn-helix transcriptional regulator [Pseudonocardiaceae bacterium]
MNTGLARSCAAHTADSDVPGHAGLSPTLCQCGLTCRDVVRQSSTSSCRETVVPDQPGSPAEPQRMFAAQLRDLRTQCDRPTQQELAAAMHCGRTMLSEMLTGRRFPTWKQAWGLIRACTGSDSKELEQKWHERWLSASRKLDALRYGQAAPGQEPPELSAAADAESGSHDLTVSAGNKLKLVWCP